MSTTHSVSPALPVLPALAARLLAGVPAPRMPGLAPLASFLVPGLGLVLHGRVRAGALILAAFTASAFIPVTVVALTAMFAFWLWGLTALYDGQG